MRDDFFANTPFVKGYAYPNPVSAIETADVVLMRPAAAVLAVAGVIDRLIRLLAETAALKDHRSYGWGDD